ncbi:hypothetical protein SeLEV6574_g06896 [Synchytrium endobioticum]|nr:hypothetical protein SeLEV6574_g06896 [Synchytrium endobioticum]
MADTSDSTPLTTPSVSPSPQPSNNERSLPVDFESTTERLEKIKERFNQQLLLRKQSTVATPVTPDSNDSPSLVERVMTDKEWASPILEENERALAATLSRRISAAPTPVLSKKDLIFENISIDETTLDANNMIPTLTSPIPASPVSTSATHPSTSAASPALTSSPKSDHNEPLAPHAPCSTSPMAPDSPSRPTSVGIDTLEATVPDDDPNNECEHRRYIDPLGHATCLKCKTRIAPLARLHAERDGLQYKLDNAKKRQDEAVKREELTEKEYEQQVALVKDLEQALEAKEAEVVAVRRDMQIMGEKLVDEIEKRAEMQHSKETFQDELEDLTKKLFEEANILVADEARRRHYHETRAASLENQLVDMRQELQTAHEQLCELKGKMERYLIAKEASQEEFDDFALESVASSPLPEEILPTASDPSRSDSSLLNLNTNHIDSARSSTLILSSNTATANYRASLSRKHNDKWANDEFADVIDPVLFAEFHDFLIQPPSVKITKLPFIRNALEDDVEPCLKFGGNPRTSTKKLVDAMMINSVFVEEISRVEIQADEERERKTKEAWQTYEHARFEQQAKIDAALKATEAGLQIEQDMSHTNNCHHHHDSNNNLSITLVASPPNQSPAVSPSPTHSSPSHMPGIISLSTSPQPRPDMPSNASSVTTSLLRGLTNPRAPMEADHSMPPITPGPVPQAANKTTKAIFNKTIWERMSAATLTGTRSPTTPAASSNPQIAEGLVPPTCMTCGRQGRCRYRFRITENSADGWVPTCIQCRDRIVAACDFYEFVRHVRSGLYRGRKPEEVYLESLAIKRRMFFARIGAAHYAKVERGLGRIRVGKLMKGPSNLSNISNASSMRNSNVSDMPIPRKSSISAPSLHEPNGSASPVKAERRPSVASSSEVVDRLSSPHPEDPVKSNVELGPDGFPKMTLSPLVQKSLLD